MIYLNLIMLTLIIVFIIDISGVIDNIKRLIWKWVFGKNKPYQEYSLKPIDCSLCMTFWIGLIFLICVGQFSILNILVVCLLASLTIQLGNLIMLVQDLFNWLITSLYKLLNK